MYKTITLYFIFSIFSIMQLSAQQPTQEWAARYNSPHSENDRFEGMVVDKLGNSYVTGWNTVSTTGNDIITLKIKKNKNHIKQPDSFYLYLNYSDKFVSVRKLTDFYRICDRHIYLLPNVKNDFTLNYTKNISELFSKGKQSYIKCNYDIKMTLPKYYYKKYEPVIAKFELINNDSKPLKIYNLFNPEHQETHIKITDNLENTWSSNKIIFQPSVAHRPQYVINPGDTFTISMALNNWAERHEKNFMTDNDWYFNQYGYFPPGRKYKAYMYFNDNNIDVYGCELRSNDAEFEVVDLEEEDIQLLNKYIIETNKFNYKALDKIIKEYPENIFTEYVTATYLLKKYWFLNSVNEYNSNDIENDYEQFISKYPESMHLLNHRFMKAFFSYYRIKNATTSELKEKIKNNLVNKITKWLF